MNVGHRILYDDLLKPNAKSVKTAKGRSALHMEKRNTLLCYRYFYYTYHQKKTYQGALEILENEFFITETTIIKTLTERQEELKEIFTSKPSIFTLKKRYQWIVWQSN